MSNSVGVPIPAQQRGRKSVYDFASLVTPGQSIDIVVLKGLDGEAMSLRVRSAASNWRIRHALDISYIIRHRGDDGEALRDAKGRKIVRVWASRPLTRGGKIRIEDHFKEIE